MTVERAPVQARRRRRKAEFGEFHVTISATMEAPDPATAAGWLREWLRGGSAGVRFMVSYDQVVDGQIEACVVNLDLAAIACENCDVRLYMRRAMWVDEDGTRVCANDGARRHEPRLPPLERVERRQPTREQLVDYAAAMGQVAEEMRPCLRVGCDLGGSMLHPRHP